MQNLVSFCFAILFACQTASAQSVNTEPPVQTGLKDQFIGAWRLVRAN